MKTLKWVILSALILLVGILGGVYYCQIPSQNIRGVDTATIYVLAGTPAVSGGQPGAVRFPNSFVDADSTTTPVYATSDNKVNIGLASSTSGLIKQFVLVDGFTDYTIFTHYRAGTATSTFCVRPMWSFDGITYFYSSFDLTATTTDTDREYATSTPNLMIQTVCKDPVTTSTPTTFSFSGEIPIGVTSARFKFYGEDEPTDYTDGVEGVISISLKNSGIY